MAKISMYNTKYEVDSTAISMSLAEGLVNRFRREYQLKRADAIDVARTIKMMRFKRRGTRDKNLVALLNRKGFLYYTRPNTYYLLVNEETPFEGLYVMVIHTKDDCDLSEYTTCITRHAVARFIYRQKEVDWVKIFKEFSMAIGPAGWKLDMEGGRDTSIRTEHGWMVCVVNTVGTEEYIIVKSWINKELLRSNQVQEYLAVGDVFARVVKDKERDVIKHHKLKEQTVKQLHHAYVSRVGDVDYADFKASNDMVVEIIRLIYNECSNQIYNPETSEIMINLGKEIKPE